MGLWPGGLVSPHAVGPWDGLLTALAHGRLWPHCRASGSAGHTGGARQGQGRDPGPAPAPNTFLQTQCRGAWRAGHAQCDRPALPHTGEGKPTSESGRSLGVRLPGPTAHTSGTPRVTPAPQPGPHLRPTDRWHWGSPCVPAEPEAPHITRQNGSNSSRAGESLTDGPAP